MLGEKLRELRTELNLNMKQASEKLGISYTTYVGYEKNEREPNSETLIKLADFYKCSVDYLIGKTIRLNFIPHEIEEAEIKCPLCDYDYVHFIRVLSVNFSQKKSSGMAMEFLCEDGHKFYIVVETYKGNTYMVNVDDNNNILGYTSFINSNSDDKTNIHKEKLITNYAVLNNFGKNKLLEYSNDLICSGNYKKDTYKIKTAARNGSFKETTVTDDDFNKLMDLPDVDDLK